MSFKQLIGMGGGSKPDSNLVRPSSTNLTLSRNGSQAPTIVLPRQNSNGRMSTTFNKRYPLVGRIATKFAESDPAAVVFDGTGSMGTDPEIFMRELPNLMSHADGLGKYSRSPEVAFGVIGDARNNENYPIQLCGFTSNIVEARKSLESLYPEGNGGGNGGESYDLGFYGLASRIDLAPKQKGFVVFLGDEPFFRDIRPNEVQTYFGEQAKFASIQQAVAAIRQKGLDVYMLLRNEAVKSLWTELLGKGFVSMLDSPEKVVQAIVGIMAGRAGRKEEFVIGLRSGAHKSIATPVVKALDELNIPPKGLIGP